MPRTRKPYPPEYREQILELAREFEPSAETIRNWIRQAEIDAGQRHDGLTTAEKQELARLRLEREILAKVAAWFARKTEAVPPKSSSS